MTDKETPVSALPADRPAFGRGPADGSGTAGLQVGLSEMLSALSHALDMTEGQPVGHTLRTCMIGMRLADELHITAAEREALYYALLLKDAGCSSNAARMAMLFGSPDQDVKYRMKLVDWHKSVRLAVHTMRTVGRGEPIWTRAAHFLRIARTPDMTRELIAIRCDRGAEIVRQIGFPEYTAAAVRSLDEHWNGQGYPDGLMGDAIPLLSRIALLAQTLEIYSHAQGMPAALDMAAARRGTWFDPQLVDRVTAWRRDLAWWHSLQVPDIADRVVASEPTNTPLSVDDAGLDRIAEAFAEIIDAKSPFTFRHSTNVARYARAVAEVTGCDVVEARRIYRAGLLHDIGKLGISNRILDKNGPLTPDERLEIERHPVYSQEILQRVEAFNDFATPAVLHHEKLDGSGYPWRRSGDTLDSAARILAVVDIYEALTADRPYRAGMPSHRALQIIHEEG
ncbi:MAG: HD domain-containing protein, partial [Gemmatimonadetes bacterium]|nr:HD domain-containing protein [Gemmatimonadota bacterium]